MASYLSAILLWLAPASIGSFFNDMIKLWVWLVIALTTFVIPLIGIVVMRLTSNIKDIQLPDREERVIPFFFIAIFYCLAAYLIISRLNISTTINIVLLTTALLVLCTAFITIFFKISVHSIGMAGVLGFLFALNIKVPDSIPVWIVIFWVLFTGFTMTSRLYLNIHRPAEIYIGGLLGIIFCFLSIYIFV